MSEVVARPAREAGPSPDGGRRELARSGAVSLVGSLVAAVGGFALTIVVGRLFGAHTAGLYFQAVAVFMILNGVALAGSDTGIVRALSARLALGRPDRARLALRLTLTPVLLWSVVVAATLAVLVDDLAATFPAADRQVVTAYLWVLVGTLVVSACGQAALNGTRSLGTVGPFVGLYQVALPLTRLLAVGALWWTDAPAGWLLLSYAVPLVLMDAAAVAILVRALRRRDAASPDRSAAPEPSRADEARELWGFNLPRGVASCLELGLVWADVIIVGILLGPAAAGAWAAASRFVTTGTMAMEALRLQSAPAMASAWARGDRRGLGEVYGVTAVWLVLASWPLFLLLATHAPLVLALVGPEFTVAATPLSVMALGMLGYVALGNVNAALLMAGRSVATARNTGVALAVNIGLNLLLVPALGLLGAAVAWAVALTLDSLLCLLRSGVDLPLVLPGRQLLAAGGAALLAFGVPGVAVRVLAAPTAGWLLAHVAVGAVVYAALLAALRRRLELDRLDLAPALRRLVPHRRRPSTDPTTDPTSHPGRNP
ncbi:polysaccharide biosynthesis C-terminal domain-containing protein [Nocardioides zeae]|uniref:Polysaccharide biosynthesis C-terminal domain-containing protein n=1 Tax=Nocardioides imazamoxiresistens TaxID=3231893 RepID=A0ABU3PYQ3_9ACTN|nr:polysaccharide biosynthesis C-terminal domain-containing protein [Nocardioides zeae]MDT9594392.1 polysaccharide biosynthesis C-terminal domain-containing protein [Nocardioides zeae]